MKKGFTLIELLISIMILSMLMMFLYKSYSGLNKSNAVFSKELSKIKAVELLKKTIYLDFTMALGQSVKIEKQQRDEDVVFLQSTHSIHNRINPYVAYIVKDKMLYRLESLKKFIEYPLASDSEFVTDALGKVKSFRVYKSKATEKEIYLIHIIFEDENEILLKTRLLNSAL